jgi:DnaJ homolog subfamily A member 2
MLRRQLKCDTCDGTGSKSKTVMTCNRCNGSGVETVLRQLGPGMVTQMQGRCSACGGLGKKRKPGDECKACQGNGVREDTKKFEVTLDKGAPDGHKVVLRGEAGISEPGLEPGDVVFVFSQVKDDNDDWKRQGNDLLLMDFPISLKQALCSTEVHIRHLDGRVLNVARPPGVPLKPTEWIRISDEGMPIHGRPFSKGNLYVRFMVQLPEALPQPIIEQLAMLLPDEGESERMDTDDAEDATMTQVRFVLPPLLAALLSCLS